MALAVGEPEAGVVTLAVDVAGGAGRAQEERNRSKIEAIAPQVPSQDLFVRFEPAGRFPAAVPCHTPSRGTEPCPILDIFQQLLVVLRFIRNVSNEGLIIRAEREIAPNECFIAQNGLRHACPCFVV